jgi:hypothetical protein
MFANALRDVNDCGLRLLGKVEVRCAATEAAAVRRPRAGLELASPRDRATQTELREPRGLSPQAEQDAARKQFGVGVLNCNASGDDLFGLLVDQLRIARSVLSLRRDAR